MSEKPKTTEAEELQRIVELIEDVTITEPDERMMIMMLASLMTGSCSKVQQDKNTRRLRQFLEAIRIIEKKHGVSLERWMSRCEAYLEGL